MVSNPFSKHKDDEPKGKDAEEAVAQELASEGADVHTFSEDASPEEKAKAAEKARADLKPKGELARQQEEQRKEEEAKLQRAVASDLGGRKVRPNVGVRDVDRASREHGQLGFGHVVPGSLPAGQPSVDIPDWFTVGWINASRRLRNLKPGELEDFNARMRDTDLVSTFLSEAYYGYMYTDAGIIVAAVLGTYFATRFGGRWGMLLIVLSICATYYSASNRRVNLRMRDDIQRELARQRMLTENETARWINNFLARFWLIYEPVLSATIVQSVDEVLKTQCPPFLDSLRLTTFTLGNKAPIVDSVRTLPDTPDDMIVMDWKFSFIPNDINDLTVYQASKKINPKVVLTVRFGKGKVGAGLPILVENMAFSGSMRIRLKLISSFPHVQVVDISFLEAPFVDFELKPVGGSLLGLDVAALPGISGFIHNQINANLGPMMYSPNQFSLNLEDLMSGTPLDTTIGVLQVTIWSARDLKGVKFAGGTPDPYIAISIDDGKEIERTKVKHTTTQPTYKETKFVLLQKLQGLLTLTTFDFNDRRPDTRLGITNFDLSTLEKNPEPGQLNKAIIYNGRTPQGSLQFSLSYYPVLKPEVAEDGSPLPLPETNAGVVRLTLHQAKNLVKNEHITGGVEPKARLLLNDKVIKETDVIKNSRDPIFEDVTEFLVTDRLSSVLTVEIIDAREIAQYASIAKLNTKIEDLLQAKQRQQDWFPVPGTADEAIRMSSQWKPVVMAGSINGSNSYRPAIGALKVWVRGAYDVKNVEALMGGKSDPYAMLRVNNLIVSGTAVMENNLSPVWNQVLYAPVHSTSELVRLEVMDYQTSTADRSLGFVDLPVNEFSTDSVNDPAYPYAGTGRMTKREKLKQPNGSVKGEIDFDVEFIPAMHISGANFIEQNKKMAAEEQKKNKQPKVPPGSAFSSPDAVRQQNVAKIDEYTPEIVAGPSSKSRSQLDQQVQPQNNDEVNPNDNQQMDQATEGDGYDANQIVAGQAVSHDDDQDDEDKGLELSPSELLQHPSGVLVFNLISGTILKQRAQLEVVIDDSYWPAYTTEKRKKNYNWDEVGEAVIRELDVSCMWLRLRKGSADEDVFAEYMCNTKELLEKCLTEPTEVTLTPVGSHAMDMPEIEIPEMRMPTGKDVTGLPGKAFSGAGNFAKGGIDAATSGGKNVANFAQGKGFSGSMQDNSVKISCRYIPMDVHLEPIESIVNQGALQIEMVSASNLRSADRGGKSDPYVIFEDNGHELARSKVVKRTLNPTWNDVLPDVVIKSRLTHDYVFNVRDWDQVSASDPLGQVHVNLAELEPFELSERTYRLTGEGAMPDSSLTVRMLFLPQYSNNRTSKGSALMGRNLASGVIGGVGGLGKGVASGGLHIATGGFHLGKGLISTITGHDHHRSKSSSRLPTSDPPASDAYQQHPDQDTSGYEQQQSGHHQPLPTQDSTSQTDSHSMRDSQSVRQRRTRILNPFKRHRDSDRS
ncbi:hypothetical protein MYAM1_001330 [Malassezia yamatoensis]|uniref:Uncharacterized protein n=1 Tax=Malassezia yamatoensis TaxID=253288 RepID=A0AAJ5YSV4_9BASI|nr:hypothetical protein MYAM1_001330 [Malassezia yamatoensis]